MAYTHKVSFKAGDGGKWMTSKVEFLADGSVNIKAIGMSDPLPNGFFEDYLALLALLAKIFSRYGGLKSLSVRDLTFMDSDA